MQPAVANDQPCAGIGEASMIFKIEKRDASTTSGEISITSTLWTGCLSAAPSVTPLPKPRIAT